MIKSYPGVSRKEFLFRFFELFNVIQKDKFKLTEKEKWLLVEFMAVPVKNKHSRFSTRVRKQVIDSLANKGWKLSQSGLSQILKSLTDKKLLELDEDGNRKLIKYLEHFIDKTRTEFKFEFYFTIDDTTD